MPEPRLKDRLSGLSPERRRLLASLLQAQAESTAVEPVADSSSVPDAGAGAKGLCRQLYDSVSRQLNAGVYGQFSYFLNYGYVPDGSPQYAAVELPEHYLDRNSVKLALELIGDCPIDNRRALDVGCGRGGTVHVLTQFFAPAAVTGIDLSPVAIEFCRRTHRKAGALFETGDAEALPFQEESFDIVTNLESSSCYPDLFAFYREVQRVLAPGGYFLYSDCLPSDRMREAIGFFAGLGFETERDRDITNNVLLSCAENAARRLQAYGPAAGTAGMEDFLAAPGSRYYEELRQGLWTYRILKLRKQEGRV